MRWVVLIGLLIGGGIAFLIPMDSVRPAPQKPEPRAAATHELEPPAPPIGEAAAEIDGSAGYDAEAYAISIEEGVAAGDSTFEEESEDEAGARPVIEELRGGRTHRTVDPEVIIYTTSWCGYCRKAIVDLDASGVRYINKDVEKDPEAKREQLMKSGGRKGVPLIDVAGEIIRGYDRHRLKAALARLR